MSDLRKRIENLSPQKRAELERILLEKLASGKERATIARRTSKDPCPLSFAQERLYFLQQLEPAGCSYNEGGGYRLKGALDVSALRRSLEEITRRHEALRTRFEMIDARPMQVVEEPIPFDLPIDDLTGTPESQREDRAREIAFGMVQQPFDLSRLGLVRARLVRLSRLDHVLLLVIHHIVTDGWSMGVFLRELSSLYNAFAGGRESTLEELVVQYPDFALWQRERLSGELFEKEISYWENSLSGAEALRLPTDRPRRSDGSPNGARLTFRLSREVTEGIDALARQNSSTRFMALMAGLCGLLSRYTGQEDIVVGSPIANRTRVELEDLIGFFANTVALRSDLSGDPSFTELLERTRKVALGAYANQDMPFEKVVERLRPHRDSGRLPFLQVVFALQNARERALEFSGLEMERFEFHRGIAKFDLTLFMRGEADGMRGVFEYNSDLFDSSTIERMAGHFTNLLGAAVANPEEPMSTLAIMDDAERRKVLVEFNDTGADYPKGECVHEVFARQALRTPNATALVLGGKKLSYDELNRRANRLANHLGKLGVASGAFVGLLAERSLDVVVSMLATLKAGGAYVPLEPSYPSERLAFMLEDTNVDVLIADDHLVGRLAKAPPHVVSLEAHSEAIARCGDQTPDAGATPDSPAYVMYTSGSTGVPKGVVIPHRGILRLTFGNDYARMDSTRTFLHLAPISFDASTWEVWAPLLHGGKCVIFPERVPTIEALSLALRENEVTSLWLTASLFNTIVDEDASALASVDEILTGGEALSAPHVRRALAALPETEIVNGYGPTESTTFTCCYRIPRDLSPDATSIPIGRPIGNTRVYILDAHMNPVPIGVPGELYIGGDGLALGYLNRDDLTAERFLDDPFDDDSAARLYRTGDVARRLAGGEIDFLGRRDHQVKLRGFRIELGEVEAALLSHGEVAQAVVLCREDSPGEKRLAAYVVGTPNSQDSPSQLADFLKGRLPEYMVPAAWVFLDALPLSANGKVDRTALPAPESASGRAGSEYVAPRTPVEEALARMWAEALGIDRVGVTDDFFALGGHSLLAVRLFRRIETVFKRKLPLATLFDSPTVEKLSEALFGSGGGDVFPPMIEIERGDGRLPLFCVATADAFIYAALSRALGADQPVYGLHPQGIVPHESPQIDIKMIASRYIDEIRTVRPHGPYVLGGMCAGGVVAYEIARQLRAQGEEVPLVALIDTPGPFSPAFKMLLRLRRANRFGDHMYHHVLNLWKLGPKGKVEYFLRRLKRLAAKLVGRKVPPSNPTAIRNVEHVYWMAFNGAYMRSMERYRPHKFDGKLVLFVAKESEAWGFSPGRVKWMKFAGGGADTHIIPGIHADILHEGPAGLIAEHLEKYLAELRGSQAPQ